MPTTKTIQLFKFEELSENAQAKVLDNERYINVDGDFWYDYDGKTGFSSDEIKKYHLKGEESDDLLTYKKLYFDLDRGQYIQFIGCEFNHEETARKYLGIPKKLWDNINWHFTNRDFGGSSHENTKIVFECLYDDRDFNEKEQKIIDQAVERFDNKVFEAWKGLRDSYEYATSDEEVKNTIEANDYTFREDGTMENI